jgi:hypothetical protein
MKSLKYLFFIAISALVVSSCAYKDDEWEGKFENQLIGSYLRLTNVVTKPSYDIDSATVENVNFNVEVEQYGEAVAEVKLFVVKGTSPVPANWKLIKTIPGGAKMTLNVKGTEMLTALGIQKTALRKGDTYTFYTQVKDAKGRTYDMSNVNAAFEGQDPYVNPTGYRSCFRFKPVTTIK